MGQKPKLYIPPAADDDQRVPARGTELGSIEMLAYFQSWCEEIAEDRLKARAKMYKNGWRDLRCLSAMATRVLRGIYGTLPNKTMSRIIAGAKDTEIRVCPKSVNRPKDYICMELEDFKELCRGLSTGGCGICLGDREAARGCKLRRLLGEYLPPNDGLKPAFDGCPYAGGELEKAVGE